MKLLRPFSLALLAALAATGVAIPAPVPAPVPAAPKDTPKTELAKLAGTWKVVSFKSAGFERIKPGDEMIIEFTADGAFEWTAGATGRGTVAKIDPSKKTKEIDYTYAFKGEGDKGIYQLDGDTFIDCFDESNGERPTEFSSTKENGYILVVYQRVKPNK